MLSIAVALLLGPVWLTSIVLVPQNNNNLPDFWEDGVLTSAEVGRSTSAQHYFDLLARDIARERGLPTSLVRS